MNNEQEELYVLGVVNSYKDGSKIEKTITFFYPKCVSTIYCTEEEAITFRNLRRKTGRKQYQLFKLTEIEHEE